MARLTGRTLFFTTSPRSPEKMLPEIRLLVNNFSGCKWNKATQAEYAIALSDTDFFEGRLPKDPSFTARDRINRAPKAYGFVSLTPVVALTPAGHSLLDGDFADILLRQLLKFQLPSPYHTLVEGGCKYHVKPFLEMLRLIRYFGSVKFDEILIFGLQLTDYTRFNEIVRKIEQCRRDALSNTGSVKAYLHRVKMSELQQIYSEEIASGNTSTRESDRRDKESFLATKASNMRDYTDALFRYLRATGLVCISHSGRSISIIKEREADVDYILKTVSREPENYGSVHEYISWLGESYTPELLSDNYDLLASKVMAVFPECGQLPHDITALKKKFETLTARRQASIIETQVEEIKNFECYDEVQNLFDSIEHDRNMYDAPLMLEWNTWRAMCMIDGGNIKPQLKFDDFGAPMTTAPANTADIVADYGDFGVAVEVTMTSRQRQFEMEGESVFRHTGRLVDKYGKPFYCLLIAPSISPSVVAYFYSMHRVNISYYGGIPKAVPLSLGYFRKMLTNARKASYMPDKELVLQFFEDAHRLALEACDENVWMERVNEMAANWTL